MSEHPTDVLREARDALVVWGTEGIAEVDAALCAVEQLEQAAREQGEPIMDARFRDRLLRHVLSNEEVAQLVDAIESRESRARAVLVLFDRKEQTP